MRPQPASGAMSATAAMMRAKREAILPPSVVDWGGYGWGVTVSFAVIEARARDHRAQLALQQCFHEPAQHRAVRRSLSLPGDDVHDGARFASPPRVEACADRGRSLDRAGAVQVGLAVGAAVEQVVVGVEAWVFSATLGHWRLR